MFRRAPGAFAAVEPRGTSGNRRPGSPATAGPPVNGALRLGGPGASTTTPRGGVDGVVTVTRPRARRGTADGGAWSGRGGGTATTRRDDDDGFDGFGSDDANGDDAAVDDACKGVLYGQTVVSNVSPVVGLQLDRDAWTTMTLSLMTTTNRDSSCVDAAVEAWKRRRRLTTNPNPGTRAGATTEEHPTSTSGRVISVGADGTEAERAFHSVHDLVHFAILSQPGRQASLRLIYSICQRAGRIASKHGGGSRLITANEHWKSQIRHALYTSPRFKRIGSDDWGVAAGHLNAPDTTVVYVSKEEREKEAHSALGVKTPSSPSKRRRASSQSRAQPRSRAQAQPRAPARHTTSVTQRVPKTSAQNDSNRSSAEPETEPLTMMESGQLLKSMRSMSSNSAFSTEHALESIVRGGLSKQRGADRASPPRGAPRSRSVSPEPRSSSTLVVVAGLLEHDQKVLPRDFRRNRRKPAGGGHHAAMPSDMDCQEACTLSVKLEQYH